MNPNSEITHALTALEGFSATERWAVPIREIGEPLVPVALAGVDERVAVETRRRYLDGRPLWARATVVDMLDQLRQRLHPLQIVVADAYRSIEYQHMRFEQVLARIRVDFPALDEDDLRLRADRLVAIPETLPERAPPHSTGGAVDMAIADSSGRLLDLGSQLSIFDDAAENLLHPTNVASVSAAQRANRVTLIEAAVAVGFANFPGEWWHFSFGDQEHALTVGRDHAIFGRADAVPGEHRG